jgi:5-methylcytosine-specific restriction enzyme B
LPIKDITKTQGISLIIFKGKVLPVPGGPKKITLVGDYKNRREPAVFNKTDNSEWFLVDSQLEQVEDLVELYAELKRGPKSAEAIQRFAVVTFHQSYGYEEFIEGIRARSDESGNISYPIEPGIFMRLCQRANTTRFIK